MQVFDENSRMMKSPDKHATLYVCPGFQSSVCVDTRRFDLLLIPDVHCNNNAYNGKMKVKK